MINRCCCNFFGKQKLKKKKKLLLEQQCVVALELVGDDEDERLAARAVPDVSGVHVGGCVDEVVHEREQDDDDAFKRKKVFFS